VPAESRVQDVADADDHRTIEVALHGMVTQTLMVATLDRPLRAGGDHADEPTGRLLFALLRLGLDFRMLASRTTSGSGAANGAVADGKPGGAVAFIAYPATYRSSGLMTFITRRVTTQVLSIDLAPLAAGANIVMFVVPPTDHTVPCLMDLLDAHLGGAGHFLLGRPVPQARREVTLHAGDAALALAEVNRDADRA